MQNLTKQQEQEFVDKLVEFREHKTTSARANNAAATRDMLCTSDSINTQVSHQRAWNPYFPLLILLYHSLTTSPFAQGRTGAYSWSAAMSMTLQLPPGTAATMPWTSGKMSWTWTQMRFASYSNSGRAPDIRVSLVILIFVTSSPIYVRRDQAWYAGKRSQAVYEEYPEWPS